MKSRGISASERTTGATSCRGKWPHRCRFFLTEKRDCPKNFGRRHQIMKKLIVLSALAALAMACGGGDNKPATDPTTSGTTTPSTPSTSDTSATPSTPATPSTGATPATPSTGSTPAPKK